MPNTAEQLVRQYRSEHADDIEERVDAWLAMNSGDPELWAEKYIDEVAFKMARLERLSTVEKAKYVRFDLVEDLIDLFVQHNTLCPVIRHGMNSPCRCGLDDLISKIRVEPAPL